MIDFASRRITMVDTQVRPNDVTKFPIIEAMLAIPREEFVPDDAREAAYVGENVPLGAGRIMFEPRTLAKMLDALDIQQDDRVLILGAGLGYTAATVARMAGTVTAVEDRADLAQAAAARLAALQVANAKVENAPLASVTGTGGFDRILIEGGVEVVPEAVLAQLKDGGRIGAVFMEKALGVARIGFRSDGHVDWRFAFNASAPVLPEFARKAEFTL